jgi:hypothetical protein
LRVVLTDDQQRPVPIRQREPASDERGPSEHLNPSSAPLAKSGRSERIVHSIATELALGGRHRCTAVATDLTMNMAVIEPAI